MSDERRYCVEWWDKDGSFKQIPCDGEDQAAHILSQIGSHMHTRVFAQLSRAEVRKLKEHSVVTPFGFAAFKETGP